MPKRNGSAYELNNAVVAPVGPHTTKSSRTGRKNGCKMQSGALAVLFVCLQLS